MSFGFEVFPMHFNITPSAAQQGRITVQDLASKGAWNRRSGRALLITPFLHISQALSTLALKIQGLFSKKSKDEDKMPKGYEQGKFWISRKCLEQKGGKLNATTFLTYLDTQLSDPDKHKKIELVREFVTPLNRSSSEVQDIIKKSIKAGIVANKTFISIPIVDSGHIVHLLIHLAPSSSTAAVEFFDSYGHSSHSYKIGKDTIDAMIQNTVIPSLKESSFDNITRVEHSNIVQKDKHSCGIFVIEHLLHRTSKTQNDPTKGPQETANFFASEASKSTSFAENSRARMRISLQTLEDAEQPANPSNPPLLVIGEEEGFSVI